MEGWYKMNLTRNPTACLICFSSSQAEPAYCTREDFSKRYHRVQGIKVTQFCIVLTSSVAPSHQCSNSARPAFTYSPLLNEQHSRRKRRLQQEGKSCFFYRNWLVAYDCKIRLNAMEEREQEREIGHIYLLNSWTLMNENIWVNTLRTKNGGTCEARPY